MLTINSTGREPKCPPAYLRRLNEDSNKVFRLLEKRLNDDKRTPLTLRRIAKQIKISPTRVSDALVKLVLIDCTVACESHGKTYGFYARDDLTRNSVELKSVEK